MDPDLIELVIKDLDRRWVADLAGLSPFVRASVLDECGLRVCDACGQSLRTGTVLPKNSKFDAMCHDCLQGAVGP